MSGEGFLADAPASARAATDDAAAEWAQLEVEAKQCGLGVMAALALACCVLVLIGFTAGWLAARGWPA